MATKSFLSDDEFNAGKDIFFSTPNLDRVACSRWLSEHLLTRLSALPSWRAAQPVRLGSWARGELCPKSDVDLLLVGEETKAAEFVAAAQGLGIRIRSRMPENPAAWGVGVEPFDRLALLSAETFSPEVTKLLQPQKESLLRQPGLRREILTEIRRERLTRQRRHDSVSNYLEPNLKYGAGGLRDLEQALVTRDLFPEKFVSVDDEAFQKISEAKEFFLTLRQAVHWLGGGDVLAATYQADLASRMGYVNLSQLMKEVQIRLERGSFYADWVVDHVRAKPTKVMALGPDRVVSLFRDDPSLTRQYQVRRRTATIWKGRSDLERGRFLKKIFGAPQSDAFWVAMSRSLFLEQCLPDLKRVKGLTQHDHYHRYTVETHLYQTIRETDRVRARPSTLFSLQKIARQLTTADWAILRWTALFHDLGKGSEKDHSTVGAELVCSRLKKMGMPAPFIAEVEWMVTNHLLLTTAAFRQNANHPSTWKRLFERGVEGRRLLRLMVFSAIDIRATNPEAWNSWKARLLSDLCGKMQSPSGVSHQRFFKELTVHKTKLQPEDLNELDAFLIESLPRQVLVSDLKNVVRTRGDLPMLVKRKRSNQFWIRFHRKDDRPGLFLEFVQKLFWVGGRVDAASVTTLKHYGVYDWFLVRTAKTPQELMTRLSVRNDDWRPAVPEVVFQSVDIISDDKQRWVLSFRGRDQKGLLLAAAKALFDLGLAIHWARVHTWGSQIDDVFCVEAKGDLQKHLLKLRERFVT